MPFFFEAAILSRMRSPVTSRSNWAKDNSTLSVRRPCGLTHCNLYRWVDMGGKLGGKFCSALVLAILALSMCHAQSSDSARLGQCFPAVSRRSGSRRMGRVVAQMLQVGAGI